MERWTRRNRPVQTGLGLVVVLIEAVDRRMLPALSLVPELAAQEARAVHIGLDAADAARLARAWMDLDLHWLPLHIEEPTGPTVTSSVRAVIARYAADGRRVTVLVPEADLGRWWQPLLHRGCGRGSRGSSTTCPRSPPPCSRCGSICPNGE